MRQAMLSGGQGRRRCRSENVRFLIVCALGAILPTLARHQVAAFNVVPPVSKDSMFISNKRKINFGYSVLLQQSASGKKLIVGAPKDFAKTHKLRTNTNRPRDGAIYTCNLDIPRSKKMKKKEICSPLTINPALRPQKTIYSCNFENNTNLEYLATGELNWTKINHATESSNTGPAYDHTLQDNGSGYFLYLEASRMPNQSSANGITAMASTPRFQATSGACVRFWYHMYGATIGSLNVYLYTNQTGLRMIWNRDGNQQNQWHSGYVTVISEDDYKIVFEAIRGIAWDGDIAIDDITITEGQCTEDLNGIGQSVGGSVAMNPKTGEVLACAPNWKHNCSGNMQVTGLCYLLSDNLTLTDQSILSPSLKQVCGTGQLDLVFLIDESSTVQIHNFVNMRYWLRNIISSLPIGKQYIQVGVAVYNADPKVIFHLNEFDKIQDFREALDRAEYRGGDTGTGKAIDFITKTMFSPEHGMRKNAKHVAVVITDGKSQDNVTGPAMAAKAKGISMIAIGVGAEVDTSELINIASSVGNVYSESDYDALEAIRGQIKQSITALESQGKTYTTEQSQAGFSSTFINQNLILGLPGLIDWSGGYAKYSMSTNGSLQVPKRTSFQSLLTSYYTQQKLNNNTSQIPENASVPSTTHPSIFGMHGTGTTEYEGLTSPVEETTLSDQSPTTSTFHTITQPFTIPKPTESRHKRSSTLFDEELTSYKHVSVGSVDEITSRLDDTSFDKAISPTEPTNLNVDARLSKNQLSSGEDVTHADPSTSTISHSQTVASQNDTTTKSEHEMLTPAAETVTAMSELQEHTKEQTTKEMTFHAGDISSASLSQKEDIQTNSDNNSYGETTYMIKQLTRQTDLLMTTEVIEHSETTKATKSRTEAHGEYEDPTTATNRMPQIPTADAALKLMDATTFNDNFALTHQPTPEATTSDVPTMTTTPINVAFHFPPMNLKVNAAEEKTIQKRSVEQQAERVRRSLPERNVTDLVTSTMSNAYFGYSVASGNVVMSNRTDLVVSAPRAMIKGQIYIIRTTSFTGSIEKDTIIRIHHGTQMGSYFGYSLCVTDTNGDGIDDIFVGSPLWFNKYEDEGRVFAYISGKEKSVPKEVVLSGLRERKSRFGFAIAAAGDLNNDQYNDLVVGAPSSANKDGCGAVYIYNGRPDGITPQHTQVIRASEKKKNQPVYFGFSLHAGLDIDNNGYNDIAVGAPGNDRVAILYTRPVIHVTTSLTASPNTFNLSAHNTNVPTSTCEGNGTAVCSNITACFYVKGITAGSMSYINYNLQADAGLPSYKARGRFSKAQGQIAATNGHTVCVSTALYIGLPVRNQLVPLAITISYSMPGLSNRKTDVSAPVLDIFDAKNVQENITFGSDCTNDTCKSDLETMCIATGKGMPANQKADMIIVDQNKMITVHISVTNRLKTAYDVHLDVKFNSSLYLIRIAPINGRRCMQDTESGLLSEKKPVQPAGIQSTSKLNLQYQYATMAENENCLFALQFGVKEYFQGGIVNIEVKTMSSNAETNPRDNNCGLSLNVKFESDFSIYGTSIKDQTVFANGNPINIVSFHDIGPEVWHHYNIYNQGPSVIPNTTLTVQWPSDLKSGHDILYLYALSCDPPDSCMCKDTDILVNPDGINKTGQLEVSMNRGHGPIDFGTPLGTAKVDKHTNNKFYEANFNCRSGHMNCDIVFCKFANINPSKTASLNLGFRIWKHTFTEANLWKATLTSQATVSVNNSHFLVSSSGDILKDATAAVTTQAFNTEFEEYSEPTTYTLNWWIYAAAACAGLLVLILVILILKKTGFFKSKYRQHIEEELEWKNSFKYTAAQQISSYEGSRDQPYYGQKLSTFQRGLPQSPTL